METINKEIKKIIKLLKNYNDIVNILEDFDVDVEKSSRGIKVHGRHWIFY